MLRGRDVACGHAIWARRQNDPSMWPMRPVRAGSRDASAALAMAQRPCSESLPGTRQAGARARRALRDELPTWPCPFRRLSAAQSACAARPASADSLAARLTVRDGVDLRRLAHRLVRLQAALGLDEVAAEEGVDKRRLAEARLADDHDVERKTALQQLGLNLRGDRVEALGKKRTSASHASADLSHCARCRPRDCSGRAGACASTGTEYCKASSMRTQLSIHPRARSAGRQQCW
jgi:hypothetical protein